MPLTNIEVVRDVLMADHKGIRVGVQFQQLTGQVQRNDASAAAHTAQRVPDRPLAHLEVVDDHGAKAGCGVEQRAVGDHKADLVSTHASLVQQLLDGGEAGGCKLEACWLHAQGLITACLDGWHHCCVIAQACAEGNLFLEVQILCCEPATLLAQLAQLSTREAPATRHKMQTGTASLVSSVVPLCDVVGWDSCCGPLALTTLPLVPGPSLDDSWHANRQDSFAVLSTETDCKACPQAGAVLESLLRCFGLAVPSCVLGVPLVPPMGPQCTWPGPGILVNSIPCVCLARSWPVLWANPPSFGLQLACSPGVRVVNSKVQHEHLAPAGKKSLQYVDGDRQSYAQHCPTRQLDRVLSPVHEGVGGRLP